MDEAALARWRRRSPSCNGAASCAESELVERRALIMTWLDAVAKNSEHGRLLAVDRLNKDPAPDQVLALALSLTLDLMRLQSGLSPDEITHQDLASELSALAATGSWLDLSQNLQRARAQRNAGSSLLMGAMKWTWDCGAHARWSTTPARRDRRASRASSAWNDRLLVDKLPDDAERFVTLKIKSSSLGQGQPTQPQARTRDRHHGLL